MCVDIILLIGVLIQNRDDTTFVHEAWVSHSDVTVWSNTRVEGEAPTHPLYIYGGREWVILPVSILLLKWRAQLLDNDQGATSLVLRSSPKTHHAV